MGSFSYNAIDKRGKTIKGTLEAENREKAYEELKKKELMVEKLDAAGAFEKEVNISFLEKKPKARDMAVFCRQFVSIVDAGVSVISALEMLGEQTENKRLRRAIGDCKSGIEKGESLASSMAQHKDIFSDIFITMVEAGEASGSLETSFLRMAEQYEKSAKLKGLIKKASIYPIVVFVVAIIVVVFMLLFVVPTFEDMFADMGTELPGITKAVLAASEFIQGFWYLLAAAIAGIVVLFNMFKRSHAGKKTFGLLAMKIPLVKNLTVKSAAARMARTLSTLIGAGIPLMDALEITSGTMSNIYFRDALLDAKDDVAMGSSMSEPLKNSKVFPPLVYHMIGIGEETGAIDDMLTKLADYYEEEVEQATQQVMAALEPLIIIVLAVVVGGIVLSVIAPMATMYTSLDSL